MSTETEHLPETWTCLGRRLDSKGKLYTSWRDAAGETHGYYKLPGQPGRVYVVQVRRAEENIYVQASPAFDHALELDDPLRVEAEANDREAARESERVKLEASDKRRSAIVELAMPIREMIARAPGGSAVRYAIIHAITEELHRPLTKEERRAAGL